MLPPRVRKSSRRWSTMWLLAPLIGTPLLLMVLLHPQVNVARERSSITGGGSSGGSSSESSRSSGGGEVATQQLELVVTPQLVATPPLVASTSTPPAVASDVPPRQDRSAQDRSALPEDTGACSPLYDVKPGVDLPQGDLEPVPHRAASVSHCCELCEARRDAGCTAVTFTPAGECWLKDLHSQAPTVQRGLISAVRRSSQPQPAESTDLPPSQGLPTAAASAAAATASAAATAVVPRGDASVCSRDPEVGCMPSPAVVVMTHNREDLLRRCIAQVHTPRCTPRARHTQQLNTPCTRCLAPLVGTRLTHTHTHTHICNICLPAAGEDAAVGALHSLRARGRQLEGGAGGDEARGGGGGQGARGGGDLERGEIGHGARLRARRAAQDQRALPRRPRSTALAASDRAGALARDTSRGRPAAV